LLGRFKDSANFQGAFLELFAANVLIRAGFQLMLEDEGDGTSKHCEFTAVSRETGKKYWVKVKVGSAAGLLAKTQRDGGAGRKTLGWLNVGGFWLISREAGAVLQRDRPTFDRP
jgi:hypothetical protein